MSALRIRPSVLLFFILLNVAAGALYLGAQKTGPVQVRAMAGSGAPEEMRLPDFSLTERSGRSVTRADFEGRPWVVDFIYTNCPAQCPMLSTKMSALQKTLPAGVGFASFSVDPEKDTPEVLSAYAGRFHAENSRWLFLTGRAAEIEKILAALGAPHGASPEAHSLRLYLLGPHGEAVGIYDTENPDSLQRLIGDARRLSEKRGP